MSGRLVCFIDDEGQVGTCIRDDEDCAKCRIDIQEDHKKLQKEYTFGCEGTTPLTQETHAQNLLDICELIKHLKRNNNAFRDLAPTMERAAMSDLAGFTIRYTDEINKTLDKIDLLVGKHYHEELIFVQQDNAKLKEAVAQIHKSLKLNN
jgi:hypothetical protein